MSISSNAWPRVTNQEPSIWFMITRHTTKLLRFASGSTNVGTTSISARYRHTLPSSTRWNVIWHHVRLKATHNRYFGTEQELKETLHSTFRSIQRSPKQITGYLQPFL